MDLKLKRLLEQAQFTKYKGRGYDAAEVDDFLDRATAMAAKVEVQLTEALGRSGAGPAAGEAPEQSGPSAEEIEAEIERRVQAKVAELPPAAATAPVDDGPAVRAAEDAAEEARRTLVLAQRTADAAMREARDEAGQLLSQAREQATTGMDEAEANAQRVRDEADAHAEKVRTEAEADARRERDQARDRLAPEIRELEQSREALRSDVHALERHVEVQRSKVGSALSELQRVLDDPDWIRLTPAPDADAPVPDGVRDGVGDAPSSEPQAPSSDPVESDEPTDQEPTHEEAPTSDEPVPTAPEAESKPAPPSFATPPPAPRRGTTVAPAADPVAITDVDHQTPGSDAPAASPMSSGSPTTPVDGVDLDLPAAEADPAMSDPSSSDDAFLAELRKAMADDEPLGPRDTQSSEPADLFGDDRPRRFGRRR